MHYIKKISKQDSLGYREPTKGGAGGEMEGEVGRGKERNGGRKKLKIQAHGNTSWRPVWATEELNHKTTTKRH